MVQAEESYWANHSTGDLSIENVVDNPYLLVGSRGDVMVQTEESLISYVSLEA
jgi:hypothetical protein